MQGNTDYFLRIDFQIFTIYIYIYFVYSIISN